MRVAPLAVALCCAACAGARPRAPPPVPERLVLVVTSTVGRLPPQTMLGQFVGGDELADVLARDLAEALRERGFGIAAIRVMPDGAELAAARASELAVSNDARAALVVALTGFDLSALRSRGRAVVDFHADLVSVDGSPLWSETRTVQTSVRLYRADSDWRSHVRQAAAEMAGDLP